MKGDDRNHLNRAKEPGSAQETVRTRQTTSIPLLPSPPPLPSGFVLQSTAGFSTSWHHWRKLVGVEFSGVRRTPLSRPSFLAQAMSVIPCAIASDMPKLTKRSL